MASICCTLTDITIQGGFDCANATTTDLVGTIDLQGPLQVNSVGNLTDVRIASSSITLTGPGGTACSNTLANRIYAINPAFQLVIGSGHALHGVLGLGPQRGMALETLSLLLCVGLAGLGSGAGGRLVRLQCCGLVDKTRVVVQWL